MRLWKINFTIDTGYDWLHRECIIIANDKNSAKRKFEDWIWPQLHGERCVEESQTKIREIIMDSNGIIYQNYLREE